MVTGLRSSASGQSLPKIINKIQNYSPKFSVFVAITGISVASDFTQVKSSEFSIMGKYKGSNL